MPPTLHSHVDTPAPRGPKRAERRVQHVGQSSAKACDLGDGSDTGWLRNPGQAT